MIYTISIRKKFFGIPYWKHIKAKSHKYICSIAEYQATNVLIPPLLEVITEDDETLVIPHISTIQHKFCRAYTYAKFEKQKAEIQARVMQAQQQMQVAKEVQKPQNPQV